MKLRLSSPLFLNFKFSLSIPTPGTICGNAEHVGASPGVSGVLSGSPQDPLELQKNFHSDSDIPTVVTCLPTSTLPVADFPCDL